MTVSLDVQIAEAKRELALRASVYPSLVARARMSQAEADEHTANMQAVLATLEYLKKHEITIRAALNP